MPLPEHGNEKIEQENVRQQEIQAQQDDGQPLGEQGRAISIIVHTFGQAGIGAILGTLRWVKVQT